MATPVTNFRLTADDKRRLERIKHLSGYATDVRVIRELLKDRLETLEPINKNK